MHEYSESDMSHTHPHPGPITRGGGGEGTDKLDLGTWSGVEQLHKGTLGQIW